MEPPIYLVGVPKMLDINLFRAEKGGNPDLVRESQRRRFADVSLVDQVCVELLSPPWHPSTKSCMFSRETHQQFGR